MFTGDNLRLTITNLFTGSAPLDDPPILFRFVLKSRFRQGEKNQLLEQMSLLRGEAPWRAVEGDFVSSAMETDLYIYICYICVLSQGYALIIFDWLTQSSHVKSTSFCGDDHNFDDFNHHSDWSTPLYQEIHQFWWVNLPLTALAAVGWPWQALQADEKLKHVEADVCHHSMGTRANKSGTMPTKHRDFWRILAISWGFNDTWGCSRGDVIGIMV